MKETLLVTDNAAKRICYLASKETGDCGFRVAVSGGGCSGFKYEFTITSDTAAEDIIIVKDGAKIIVDPLSLTQFLQGSTLDYEEKLGSAEFKIINPNASAKCGCGNSFAV